MCVCVYVRCSILLIFALSLVLASLFGIVKRWFSNEEFGCNFILFSMFQRTVSPVSFFLPLSSFARFFFYSNIKLWHYIWIKIQKRNEQNQTKPNQEKKTTTKPCWKKFHLVHLLNSCQSNELSLSTTLCTLYMWVVVVVFFLQPVVKTTNSAFKMVLENVKTDRNWHVEFTIDALASSFEWE